MTVINEKHVEDEPIKLTTTIRQIKKYKACENGLEKLLTCVGKDYPEDEEINLTTILNGVDLRYFFWAMRAVNEPLLAKKITVQLAVSFSERVLHIFEEENPKEHRPRHALDTVKYWLENYQEITDDVWQVEAFNIMGGIDDAVMHADTLEAAWAMMATWVAVKLTTMPIKKPLRLSDLIRKCAYSARRAIKDKKLRKREKEEQVNIAKKLLICN